MPTKDQATNKLAAINERTLAQGEHFPEVELADGTKVRTGTVAGVITNIDRYNRGERGEIEQELALAIPTLLKAGLFDVFPPEDWITGNNEGRAFVGRQARTYIDSLQKNNNL